MLLRHERQQRFLRELVALLVAKMPEILRLLAKFFDEIVMHNPKTAVRIINHVVPDTIHAHELHQRGQRTAPLLVES
jgi:hypothetical protein